MQRLVKVTPTSVRMKRDIFADLLAEHMSACSQTREGNLTSPLISSPSCLLSFSFLSISPLSHPPPALSLLPWFPFTSGCLIYCLFQYITKFSSLVQFKCTDCPLVPLRVTANVRVSWWLPSRPLVIVLVLTRLRKDMCYKSNQKLGGEDTGMCHPQCPFNSFTDWYWYWLFCTDAFYFIILYLD